jgi:serralysin
LSTWQGLHAAIGIPILGCFVPKNTTGGGSQDNPAQADDTDSRLGAFDAMDSAVTRAAAAPALPSISASSGFQLAISSTNPESVVAVTSGGMTINLLFDAAAPSSFRAAIQQAAAMLTSVISDQITVNLNIHYSGTGGGASAGPDNGLFESYSSTIAALINHASLGDTIFSALPGGSSVQGQTSVAVWNAQLKALGFLGATAGTDDGEATFARDINPNLLVGVALHELTHALGRVPYGSQPDIFDLFRFTSPGARLFLNGATAPAAYFSVDGGFARLADYGQTSDSSDFNNGGVQGPNDPFNEFYSGSTSQQLTTVDLLQLDALGLHLTSNTPITIEASGSTSLMVAGNHVYYLVPVGGSSGPQLRFAGAPVIAGQFGPPWVAIGAEHNASGGYQVVWTMPGANQYTVWTTDSSGNYTSQTPTVTSASWYVQSLEASFNQDLNGDGRIGPVTTTVEASGSTTLAKVADSYFLYPVGGSSGPQLRYAGAYTAAGQFGAWTPIGAEHNASGGYAVAWKMGAADQYTVWTTDSSGNYTSQTPAVTSASWYVQSLEQSFNQDLNGDGRLGPVTTNVETSGATTLAKVADSYFLYPAGGSSGPQLLWGAYVAAGQFGAWTPIGAEHNASGGYAVAWKMGAADQYTVWTTDSSGNYLSQSAVVSGSSSTIESLEPSFNQDLNGDGTIGFHTAPIDASGNYSAAAVFTMSSHSMVAAESTSHLLSAGPANVGTLGSDTTIASGLGTESVGNGGSGAGSLALLTSYLASTFVTPAGAGTGAVGEAQSSGQDFLAKPAA